MPDEIKPRELRNFGLLLGALFAAIFGGIPLLRHHRTPLWPWIVAVLLWLAALLAPRALRWVHRGWTRLGLALGWVNTRVILTLVYAIAVVPIGMVMRLMRRDPMERDFDRARDSYRVASRRREPADLEKPY